MKTVGEILKGNQLLLERILGQYQTLASMTNLFARILEPYAFGENCRFVNYQEGSLFLVVTSPTWATKLHYFIPNLLKELRIHPEFKEISRISYTVDRSNFTKNYSLPKPLKLSAANEILWQELKASLQQRVHELTTLHQHR